MKQKLEEQEPWQAKQWLRSLERKAGKLPILDTDFAGDFMLGFFRAISSHPMLPDSDKGRREVVTAMRRDLREAMAEALTPIEKGTMADTKESSLRYNSLEQEPALAPTIRGN